MPWSSAPSPMSPTRSMARQPGCTSRRGIEARCGSCYRGGRGAAPWSANLSHVTHTQPEDLVQTHRLSRRHALAGAAWLTLAAAARRPGTALAQELDTFTVPLDWYPNANHAGLFLA